MGTADSVDETVERNRELQRQVLGTTLFDLFGRARTELGLTQQQLADIVGLSQPMISQLASGRRGLPSNPAVQARLRQLTTMEADGAGATASVSPQELATIRRRAAAALTPLPRVAPVPHAPAPSPAAAVHRLLTDLASPVELAHAAEATAGVSEAVSELLRHLATMSRPDFIARYEGLVRTD